VSRARLLILGFLAPLSILASILAGPAACGSTAGTDTLPPITGIVVPAEALTTGHGCGRNATQIFKYLVVVYGVNPADANLPPNEQRRDEFLASNVYDCFADGQFVELPASGGSARYALQVYVYNAAAYDAAGGDAAIMGKTARLASARAALLNDGGAAERETIQTELAALPATNPTFNTTCAATQSADVQSLAVCDPLRPGASAVGTTAATATVVLSAASFPAPDGGTVTCDDQYTTVRYRFGTGGTLSAPVEARCSHVTANGLEPLVITVSQAVAPASYVFEVALLRNDASALGLTTCTAQTSAGLTSSATCAPIR
jgi:hypothetical protein